MIAEIPEKKKIAVVGLGYVGLPIALALSEHYTVVGYDISKEKIDRLNNGCDDTGENCEKLKKTTAVFTDSTENFWGVSLYIIAVPTPVTKNLQPDLGPLLSASETVGRFLKKGDVVCYESTVFPYCTERVCAPVLERESGLKQGVDFFIGYSPERINPSDRTHVLSTVTKVVAAENRAVLAELSAVYGSVAGGVHSMTSIADAEAAKVIENAQRDINIAFMNELSVMFHLMNVDLANALAAAKTKWNFLDFTPGLVGGHCIGVDPYYLTYAGKEYGYHSEVILSGRRINDGMGKYVAVEAVKLISRKNLNKQPKIAVFGCTFKENCNDVRNSKVFDIVNGLKEFGYEPQIYDPIADRTQVERLYGETLSDESPQGLDCAVFAVAHTAYKMLKAEEIKEMFATEGIIVDVKGIFDKTQMKNCGFDYWRL